MKAAECLPHLNNVQLVKSEQWKACCPAHSERNPSLIIKETDDRVLIHCRAGCRTSDVSAAVRLDFPDLFLDGGNTKSATNISISPKPEPLPFFRWDWRKTCAELESMVQATRERSERIIEATVGFEYDQPTRCRPWRNMDASRSSVFIVEKR